jgi:D-alanine--poly(phosphoribitol) ligase subunit 1
MTPILDSIYRHAQTQPMADAIVADQTRLSYGGFWELAARIAAAIVAAQPQPQVLIAAPGGAFAYAAMIGTLMAGGFYAPLNVRSPLAKQRQVLDRFRPNIIVGIQSIIDELLDGDKSIPIITADQTLPAPLDLPKASHDLAYVIFTSGSTGQPKGVEIPLAGLENYAAWAVDEMSVTPDDRWSQHPNIGFDLSVLDIYGALCGGASLHVLSELEAKLAPASFIRRHQLTIWNSVPSVIDVMHSGMQLTHQNLKSLRLMTFCGEPLLRHHLEKIFAAHPDVLVHNTYGPTEATVSCTLRRLTAENFQSYCGLSAAIGDPIRNMDIALAVDQADGNEGEIVITGVQLARGYWQDELATRNAFRPWRDSTGERRAFYTGDWAIRRDRELYFKERVDHQVKIGGHRLELEEVNAAVRKCGAEFAATLLVDGTLHCFVRPENLVAGAADLKKKLMGLLEPHAVPASFHFLEDLVFNANDKLDLSGLKAIIRQKAAKP